jgi:hypothetical protein
VLWVGDGMALGTDMLERLGWFGLYQDKVFEVLNKVSEVPFLAQYKEQIDVRALCEIVWCMYLGGRRE